MKSRYWAGLVLGVAAVASCDDDGVRCGVGTAREGDVCLPKDGAGFSAAPGNSDGNGEDAGKGGSAAASSADAGMGGDRAEGGAAGADSMDNGGDSAGGNSAGNGGTAGTGPDQTGLITTALDCGSRDVTGASIITEPITQDTTWSGVIHLPNGLSVRNEPTLTIAPGTKIIVGHGATLEFGWLGSHATIVANGTLDQPIKFCGETDTPGYWGGMIFRSGIKTTSVLRNVLITDGGATDAGLTLEMPLRVQGVQVRHSGANGVNAVGFDPASSTLTVSGSTNAAIKATAVRGAQVPLASQLTGNGLDLVDIAFGSFDADVTLRDLGVPYRQLADTTVASAAAIPPVVTFEPGVVYWLAKQKRLDFGMATVHALGSASNRIVFQGVVCPQPEAPCPSSTPSGTVDAGGRVIASGTDVRFEYVDLRKLGTSTDAALTVQGATLEVNHLNIIGAPMYGLAFTGFGKFSADSNNLNVGLAQGSAALQLGCSQVATLPDDTTISSALSSDVYTTLDCTQLEANANWPSAGSPYSLPGLEILANASLTLQPGVTLRFAAGNQLLVDTGGTLNAIGTLTSTIQFLRESANNWGGIYADTGSTVRLDYAVIDRAGAGTAGSALVAQSPIWLTHSTISNSSSWALKKAATDGTDYLSVNTFRANSFGNISDLP